jgi:hypothetical protein
MKDSNVKQVCLGKVTSGHSPTVNGEGQEGWVWSMCFIYMYEDRTLKSVLIILSRREGIRENDGGDEFKQGVL